MSRFIEDADGDHIQVVAEQEGALHGVTIAAAQREEPGDGSTWHHATVGPVDPHALIEAIKAECEMHEDDEIHKESIDLLADHWKSKIRVAEEALRLVRILLDEEEKA